MLTARSFALALAAVLVSACASNPRSPKSSTDVVDGAAASRDDASLAAAPAAPEPGTCVSDSDCGDGERCSAGRCAAAPSEASCGLVRIAFAFDSAQLDEQAMRHLRDNADCLTRRGATALLIEGHCDERGTTEYNIALGARRADAVKRYLVALGVSATIDSVSFGKELPLAQGSGDAAWAQNRRAEMRLPGETRSDGRLVAGR